ncbi:hypothetical protein AAFF_G00403520 [Aldrovandia affinis]|uniref:GMP reductase n=1 Tax=Aldrovandia affinis TaxID=143900 RepID=A0AAD7T7P5_9TELE|nr:hypothetical protein AAFF_G00403520 [Aldrovandia affinis]
MGSDLQVSSSVRLQLQPCCSVQYLWDHLTQRSRRRAAPPLPAAAPSRREGERERQSRTRPEKTWGLCPERRPAPAHSKSFHRPPTPSLGSVAALIVARLRRTARCFKYAIMPRVDADLKLDFKDVLFRPKRSSLQSRAEVELQRTFTFRNSRQTYRGVPVIAANMDTTGTFEIAQALSRYTLFTAIQKHYTVEDWKAFEAKSPECLEYVAASSGSSKSDLERLSSVLESVPGVRYICLDVANGYSKHFVDFVKIVREVS